ncbi:Hypothetical protein SMAX5B_018673 [Scophthalmus maximus]|uniref:Uncharacterized protein n=1 Tax=Scophthalmus maximus TaxID=52904 RepID=A0A2U9CDE0_SCOMX|nr:Hypothetical protein SMAX5B_018673 [Scophthalmus maximus]
MEAEGCEKRNLLYGARLSRAAYVNTGQQLPFSSCGRMERDECKTMTWFEKRSATFSGH